MIGRLLPLVAALGLAAAPAAAQPAPAQRYRFEIAAGGLWLGGASMGTQSADLRSNRTPPAPFTLFTTDTDAAGAPGFDGRLTFWLTQTIAVEGGFVFARPALRTRISGDVEEAPALTVEDRLDQYFVEAGLVWLLEPLRIGDRTVPFVTGGAGYLRQLHEGRLLVETGRVFHAGGGLRHWLRQRRLGWIRALGLRADARVYLLADGVSLGEETRAHAAISGLVFVTF